MTTFINWCKTHHCPIAIAGVTGSAAVFVLLHVMLAAEVSPRSDPVSSYSLSPPGDLLFGIAAGGIGIACLALSFGGLHADRPPRRFLAGAASGLVLVVAFRTDDTADVSTAGGEIHRYSAGLVFVMITAAGVSFWYRRRDTKAARLPGALALLSCACLLMNCLNTFFPTVIDGGAWRGIPQRVMLVVQAALLVMLASMSRRGEPATAPVSPAPTMELPAVPTVASSSRGMPDPDGDTVWFTGRGGSGERALLSANGLQTRTVCRQ